MNLFGQLCIVLLPIVSIFLTGLKYPVQKQIVKPVFQPPDYVFSIVWTYITLMLGIITNMCFTMSSKFHRIVIMIFYITLLILLNGWLVLNYYEKYALSFYTLLVSCYISITYICYLFYISNRRSRLCPPRSRPMRPC